MFRRTSAVVCARLCLHSDKILIHLASLDLHAFACGTTLPEKFCRCRRSVGLVSVAAVVRRAFDPTSARNQRGPELSSLFFLKFV